MNALSFSGLTIFVTSLIIIVILTFYGRNRLHRVWTFFNAAVCVWGIGTFLAGHSLTPEFANLSWKIAISGGLFIGAFMYHTVCIFIGHRNRIALFLIYLQALVYLGLTLANMQLAGWRLLYHSFYYNTATLDYYCMVISWVAVVFISFYNLVKFYGRTSGIQRLQTQFFLFGALLGFLGGGTVLLPAFGIPIYPIGNFTVAL